MIIAWWHKDHPQCIDLIEEDILPWSSANWIEKRPATEEEIKMYQAGIKYNIYKQKGE